MNLILFAVLLHPLFALLAMASIYKVGGVLATLLSFGFAMIFDQENHPIPILAGSANNLAGTVSMMPVNIGQAGHLAFLLTYNSGGTGTHQFTVNVCPTVAGGSGVAVPYYWREYLSGDTPNTTINLAPAGSPYTSTAGAPKTVLIMLDDEQVALANNGAYVQLVSVEQVASAVNVTVVAIAADLRNARDLVSSMLV
jgi:hypothetical protein